MENAANNISNGKMKIPSIKWHFNAVPLEVKLEKQSRKLLNENARKVVFEGVGELKMLCMRRRAQMKAARTTSLWLSIPLSVRRYA